jgi:hypothetical protein
MVAADSLAWGAKEPDVSLLPNFACEEQSRFHRDQLMQTFRAQGKSKAAAWD